MRIEIKWGLIFAGAVIVWTAVVHLLGIYTTHIEYADAVDRWATVIPVTVMFLALSEKRRASGDTLSIGRGVLTGLAVAVVSVPPTVAAFWVYHHYVNPEWLTIVVTYQQQKLAADGVPAEQIASRIALLQRGGADRQLIVGAFVGTLIIGLVLSLIITPLLALVSRMRRGSARS